MTLVSFFNEVDVRSELYSGHFVSFFNEDPDLVSFFKEIDIGTRTML